MSSYSMPFLSGPGGPRPFRELYPQVKALTLTIRAEPRGFGEKEKWRYSLDDLPGEVFSMCPSLKCNKGGYQLGVFLRGAVSARERVAEDMKPCIGYERMTGNRRRCYYAFYVRLEVEYHEDAESPRGSSSGGDAEGRG